MNWHLTWQDPVAWAIVGLVLVVMWRRRAGQPAQGCSSCGEPEELPATGRVSITETRLAGHLKE